MCTTVHKWMYFITSHHKPQLTCILHRKDSPAVLQEVGCKEDHQGQTQRQWTEQTRQRKRLSGHARVDGRRKPHPEAWEYTKESTSVLRIVKCNLALPCLGQMRQEGIRARSSTTVTDCHIPPELPDANSLVKRSSRINDPNIWEQKQGERSSQEKEHHVAKGKRLWDLQKPGTHS